MIPILYGSVGGEITSTVEAYLQSQGIGPLTDCIEGVVIEERNGQYELEMTYPITGRHYTDIAISCCIKVVPFVNGTPQLFEIYRMTKPINGRVKIYGRHIGYRLSYNTVTPFSLSNCTAAQAFAGLKSHAVEDCPFTFWTDFSGTAVSFKIGEPMSFRSCLGGTDGSILDLWSGEYEWDNFTIKFHNGRGTDNGVSLRYGKNITDLTQDENIENTITGIVPFWKGYDENSQEVIVSCGPVYSSNADRFSFKRTVPHDFSPDFSEAPTVQLLQQTAQAWVTNNKIGEPDVDLTVSFVQLADTTDYKNLKVLETVNLCDTVHVEFPELGVSATSKVIRTEYDFTKDRYKSITLGSTKASNLVKTIQEIATPEGIEDITRNQNALEQAVANVTKAIRGSNGGYVKMLDTNGDGYTDEIVILDADSNGVLEDAVNVWRWNNRGLGFSSNGYMGPYTTAITADGKIVANFITAGVLTGLEINNGNGTFHVSASGTVTANSLEVNNGNGTFQVDTSGNVTANSLTSNNATITGGSFQVSSGNDQYSYLRFSGSNYQTEVQTGLIYQEELVGSSRVSITMTPRQYEVKNSSANKALLKMAHDPSFGGELYLYDENGAARLHIDAHDGLSIYAINPDYDTNNISFYDSNLQLQGFISSNPAENAILIGETSSSSWTSVTWRPMKYYRAFVLNACRGSGSGVMASTYIPYEQARLCTSSSVETWAHSAQNGNYSGRCYFDFTNNRIYLISSGYSDCKVKIYGIT